MEPVCDPTRRTSVLTGPGDEVAVLVRDELADVARVRQVATRCLVGAVGEDVVDDAVLVLSELVTNALIHAEPPRTVAIRLVPGGVHLEVSDRSRTAPEVVQERLGPGGRGMRVVARLCAQWGARPTPTGKVVWARITGPEGIGA